MLLLAPPTQVFSTLTELVTNESVSMTNVMVSKRVCMPRQCQRKHGGGVDKVDEAGVKTFDLSTKQRGWGKTRVRQE